MILDPDEQHCYPFDYLQLEERLVADPVQGLSSARLRVLTHPLVPPNDGGLAFGPAVIAVVSDE